MEMNLEYSGKRSFKVSSGGHEILTDLPQRGGGDDSAPTASELFVASLGACMALFGVRYLETAKMDPEDFAMKIQAAFSEDKKRIENINFTVSVPNAELGPRKKALIAAMEQCVLHHTLHESPEMPIEIIEQ
ncbi:MAG: OsmC family protein [Candidatus Omnitrophota bacterium]